MRAQYPHACEQEWKELDKLLPSPEGHARDVADHIHEDLELQGLDFTTYNIEWTAHVPGCGATGTSRILGSRTTHTCARRCRRCSGRTVRAGKPARRWLLKCPQHLENLPDR